MTRCGGEREVDCSKSSIIQAHDQGVLDRPDGRADGTPPELAKFSGIPNTNKNSRSTKSNVWDERVAQADTSQYW